MGNPYAGIASPVSNPYAGIAAPVRGQSSFADTAADAARSFASHAVQGVANLADQVAPAFLGPAAPLAQTAMALMGHGDLPGMPVSPAHVAQNVTHTAFANAATPTAYEPHTTAGRYAGAVGLNVPNAALGGGGALARTAAVVAPGLASEAAGDIAGALGAGPKVKAGAKFVGGLLGGAAVGLRTTPKPAPIIAPAEQPVAGAVAKSLRLGQSTPADVHAGMDRGLLPVATSPGLAGLGEAVASTPGPAGVLLKGAIAERMGTQTDRALGAVQDHLGIDPASARGDIDAMVTAGRKSVGPSYDAMRDNPAPVWNSDLAALAQRPAIKKAIGVAANDMLNAGENPTAAGLALDPDTGWHIPAETNPAGTVIEQQPTAATWIKVHQALGRTVDRSPVTNRPIPDALSPGNLGINTAARALRDALAGDAANGVEGAIPGYADTLNKAGDYLSMSNAFDRARGKLFTGNVADFGAMWKSLGTDAEKNAARSALANEVLEVADRNQNGLNPGRFRAPGVQKKLAIAFGDDKAQSFVDQMESDAAEKATYNDITSNSRSTPRAALIAEFQKSDKPKGVLGAVQGVVDNAHTIASMFHPATALTKIASGALHMAGGNGKTAALPWDDPQTAAQLGGVLSDPAQMRGLLGRMSAQEAQLAQVQAARRAGLLTSPVYSAPSVKGLLAP